MWVYVMPSGITRLVFFTYTYIHAVVTFLYTHTCTHTHIKLDYNCCTTNIGLNLYGNSDRRLRNQCAKKNLKQLEEKKERRGRSGKKVLTTKHKQVSILSSTVRLFCLDKAC